LRPAAVGMTAAAPHAGEDQAGVGDAVTIPQPRRSSAVNFGLALAELAILLARVAIAVLVPASPRRRPGQRAHLRHGAGDLGRGRLAGHAGVLGAGHCEASLYQGEPWHGSPDPLLSLLTPCPRCSWARSEHGNRVHRGPRDAFQDQRCQGEHELPAAVLDAGLCELLEVAVVDEP